MIASQPPLAVTIVMPLYKPRGNWVHQFLTNTKKLRSLLPAKINVHYVVVYDDKPNNEMRVAFQEIENSLANIRFITYDQNRGKGFALREGVRASATPYTLITDFDFPYEKENMVDLIEQLGLGYDVVIGKRSDSYFKQLPLKRKFISKVCIGLKRLFLDLPFYDTQSGIKAFNRRGREVFLTTTVERFMVDTEFVLRSQKQRLNIKETKIELENYVEFSNFGYRVLKTELLNFLRLIKLNYQLKRKPLMLSSRHSSYQSNLAA